MRQSQESGQAVLEYILTLAMVVGLGLLIYTGIKQSRDGMWRSMICDVAAPCTSCPAPESAKSVINTTKGKCR